MDISIVKSIIKIFCIIFVVGIICTGGVNVIVSLIEKGTAPGPRTIEEISGINLDDVNKIETTKTINGTYNVDEFKKSYREQFFVPFTDELSLKKCDTYKLYGIDDKIIMTLKDCTYDSVVELNVGGEISLHKRYTPPET